MIGHASKTLIRVFAVCVFAALGFVLFQERMRAFEADVAISSLRAVGVDDVVEAGPTTVLVIPHQRAAFHVLVTPSCSSLASLLAFGCLTPLLPRRGALRREAAITAAVVLIVAGNIVRIAASMAVGIFSGRSSLVLFHDWVGSTFTIVYTIVGFIFVLMMLLPKDRRQVAITA